MYPCRFVNSKCNHIEQTAIPPINHCLLQPIKVCSGLDQITAAENNVNTEHFTNKVFTLKLDFGVQTNFRIRPVADCHEHPYTFNQSGKNSEASPFGLAILVIPVTIDV